MKYLLLPLLLCLTLLSGCAQQNTTYKFARKSSPPPQSTVKFKELSVDELAILRTVTEEENDPRTEILTPALQVDAWEKIAKSPSFSNTIDNTEVGKYRDWYTGRQHYFDRPTTRARLYLAHIIEELENNSLPLELALIPFLESSYNPFAKSPSGAAGLWQFMRPTGDHLGLKRDHWYDERHDIISSTDAAIRYFKYLNKRFEGDWLLTLAAYNAGEGTVNRAMEENQRKGKPSDFWSLRLPRQTKVYVPKLIALAQVIASPDDYQLTLPAIPAQAYFEVVELPQQIDLYQVSLLAEMSLESLYSLNPGFQQSVTPPEGPHRLLIPQYKTAGFTSRLGDTPKSNWLEVLQYKVQAGDTLSTIAQRHGVSSQLLMAKNNMKSSQIFVGQTLKIPRSSDASRPRLGSPRKYYRVRRGDSLWEIAKANQVKTENLARWNGLKLHAPLQIGKRLRLRAPSFIGTKKSLSYQIKKGDSLSLISKQFNVSVNDIVRWNKLNPKSTIKVGQTLKLFPHS